MRSKSLLDLPEAILQMIVALLDDVPSLGRAAQVHSLLRLVVAEADAWERIAQRHDWLLRRRECAAPIDLCRRVHTGSSAERLVFIGGDPGLTLDQELPLQMFDPTLESWEVFPVHVGVGTPGSSEAGDAADVAART